MPVTVIPAPRTEIPSLAVINPTESILVTSSYVRVPAIPTSPLKYAPVAVINPTVRPGSPVNKLVPFPSAS